MGSSIRTNRYVDFGKRGSNHLIHLDEKEDFDERNRSYFTGLFATRKFSYATRIVELAAYPLPDGAESRQLEVTASFHGLTPGTAERYQIRLAAFAEEPGGVKAIWHSTTLFDQVLQHVGRTIVTKPDDAGWKTLTLTMDIPPGTRSLVISLGAGRIDDAATKTVHYLDDVHAKFSINDSKVH